MKLMRVMGLSSALLLLTASLAAAAPRCPLTTKQVNSTLRRRLHKEPGKVNDLPCTFAKPKGRAGIDDREPSVLVARYTGDPSLRSTMESLRASDGGKDSFELTPEPSWGKDAFFAILPTPDSPSDMPVRAQILVDTPRWSVSVLIPMTYHGRGERSIAKRFGDILSRH